MKDRMRVNGFPPQVIKCIPQISSKIKQYRTPSRTSFQSFSQNDKVVATELSVLVISSFEVWNRTIVEPGMVVNIRKFLGTSDRIPRISTADERTKDLRRFFSSIQAKKNNTI